MLNEYDEKFDLNKDGKLDTWEQQNKLNIEYDMPVKKRCNRHEIPDNVPDEVYEKLGKDFLIFLVIIIIVVISSIIGLFIK